MRDTIEQTVAKYITSPSARAVASELIMGFLNMERIAREEAPSQELRHEVVRTFITVFLDLPANPFWRDNAGYLSPIVSTVCNAWLDAVVYANRMQEADRTKDSEGAAEALVRSVGLRAGVVEIALAVLYCERGAGGLRDNSHKFRDALIRVMEQ